MNYETLIPLTLIYSVFLVVGVLGNLATCLVILFNVYMRWGLRDLISKTSSVIDRNATNVYLTNLAVTDIFTLVLSK